MSPEQAAGDRELDGRSDIYSLGCVLYEMLAGEPPYTGSTAQAILAKIATDEPRRVAELRETVPGHVEGAVHKALQKLPADRFGRAGELGDAVGTSASATTVGVPWKLTRLKRVVFGLAVATAGFATLAVIGWLATAQREAPRPLWLDLNIVQGGYAGFDLARDGSALVYRGPDARHYVRELGTRETRVLTAGQPFPFFSPDGAWVASMRGPSGFWKVPRTGGPVTTVPFGASNNNASCTARRGDPMGISISRAVIQMASLGSLQWRGPNLKP